MDEQIELLQKWIDECNNRDIVFFGGAGVSTESGIPDFRSQDGLYNQKYKFPPEVIVSHTFFTQHTKDFFDFYFDKMIFSDAKPNAAHLKLAELEKAGKLGAVVTQNIDGLHQAAGCENVLELHGSVHRNYCTKCGKFFDLEQTIAHRDEEGIPRCECGGIIKPDVVLYEEPLDGNVISKTIDQIENAKLLIIAGTSLVVYPAASFISYFRGDHTVIINLSSTSADKNADLCITQKVGEVFSHLQS